MSLSPPYKSVSAK